MRCTEGQHDGVGVKLSVYVGASRDLRRCVDAIGLHGVWLPATLGLDSLTALTVAAMQQISATEGALR